MSLRIKQLLQENQFLRITSLGEILRSMRLTVKVRFKLRTSPLWLYFLGHLPHGPDLLPHGQSAVHAGD